MVGLEGVNFDPIACGEALGYEKMTQGDNSKKIQKQKFFLACHKNLAIFKYEPNLYQFDILLLGI